MNKYKIEFYTRAEPSKKKVKIISATSMDDAKKSIYKEFGEIHKMEIHKR